MITVADLLAWGREMLANSSPSARLDTELLLGLVTERSRPQLLAFPEYTVAHDAEVEFRRLVAERARHVPIAYLRGSQEFYGRDFTVSPAVLIPRPETELLVDHALAWVAQHPECEPVRLLDLGTGSGCLAVTLAAELSLRGREAQILAVDFSAAALAIARTNALRHHVERSVALIRSSWLSALHASFRLHLAVANPPYIPDDLPLCSPEVLHEPLSALTSGPRGLDDILHLLHSVPAHLAPSGLFLCECGHDQEQEILEAARALRITEQCTAEFIRDLAGIPRVLALRRRISDSNS